MGAWPLAARLHGAPAPPVRPQQRQQHALRRRPPPPRAKPRRGPDGSGDIIGGLLRFADKYAGVADKYLGLVGGVPGSSSGPARAPGARMPARMHASHAYDVAAARRNACAC